MNNEQRARYITLVEFLEKLASDEFDFNFVVNKFNWDCTCGTVCCAIGWTPRLFPDIVKWIKHDTMSLNVKLESFGEFTRANYEVVAAELFGIPVSIAYGLFCPDNQHDVHSELPLCSKDAEPQEVAVMLRKFLELVDAGKIQLN